MAGNKDILWVRNDVLNNKVSLYAKTWNLHAEKHTFDKVPATEEHIFRTVTDPDHARRSNDPDVGHETCVFEKHFVDEGQAFIVPVIYDGVEEAGDYDQGGKAGRVTTGYFPDGGRLSKHVGQIFWSKSSFSASNEVSAIAADADKLVPIDEESSGQEGQ